MSDTELQRRIEDARIEGWAVAERMSDDRAVMVRRSYGTLGGHVLIALLTVWWTFGLGNICYAAYKYFLDKEKRVVRAEE